MTTLRALVVDDEAIIRDSLKAILAKANGYQVDFAADGIEAINLLRENYYDIMLLDLIMPRVDGYEVLKSARTIYPGLPVVFITGKANTKMVEQSIAKHHLNGFIEKPFTPEEVIDVVNKALTAKPKV